MKMALSPVQLRMRLESLARELYDYIRLQVFTTSPIAIAIDRKFKLPHLLHINKASRAAFARLYFSQTSFTFTSQTLLIKWMNTIDLHHVNAVSKVTLIAGPGSTVAPGIGGWNLFGSVQKREILLAVGMSWKDKLRVVDYKELSTSDSSCAAGRQAVIRSKE
ncbi:hypothetical protein Slin15195_G101610 [Septoria linicola]|uniref:Uncharacterized protein n=1 Tax=Septoria linicola TaxID=215465 RepID=A0A9Q9AVU5_9PEZI|nr:hypothetical protein Slin15195_G101610 [Septoria linicola]